MSKDERYIKISKEIASWSKDPSTKVGVVIVGDKGQIVSQGYNGFPRGFKDTIERYSNRPTKYKYIIHAERRIYGKRRSVQRQTDSELC